MSTFSRVEKYLCYDEVALSCVQAEPSKLGMLTGFATKKLFTFVGLVSIL